MSKYNAGRDLNLTVNKTWYLFANRSEAVIYVESPERPFDFVERFENPEARLQERELTSDRPGRGRAGLSGNRHGIDETRTQHDKLATDFAGRLGRHLEQSALAHGFTGLVVVAESRFLGFLREQFSDGVKKLVIREIHGDYVRHSPERLLEDLRRAG